MNKKHIILISCIFLLPNLSLYSADDAAGPCAATDTRVVTSAAMLRRQDTFNPELVRRIAAASKEGGTYSWAGSFARMSCTKEGKLNPGLLFTMEKEEQDYASLRPDERTDSEEAHIAMQKALAEIRIELGLPSLKDDESRAAAESPTHK